MTTNQERYRLLAAAVGLSGGWLEVSRNALLDRTVRMPSGCYFLCWGERTQGVLWLEGEQGRDNRTPPEVAWISAWQFAEHRPIHQVRGELASGVFDSELGMRTAFRACQEFAHREALLRQVGFHQWEGPFGLLECVGTPVTWEWR